MKRIVYLLLFSVIFCRLSLGQAQHCSDVKGFRTDPQNAHNPDGNCGILNTFDWRKLTHTVYNQNGTSFQVPSPYLTLPHFNDQTLSSYLDYAPNDGWELIKAGEQDLPIPQGNYAYFILYNKYGSFLRIFFTLNPTQAGQATRVHLQYNSSILSGLLHPTQGINQPMDRFSIPEAMGTVRSNNEFGHFTYVDIPVEYDPCTCGFPSALRVEFNNVVNQRIDLTGRYWALNRTLAEINQSQIFSLDSDYLLTVLQSSTPQEVLGTQTFAHMKSLLDYYQVLRNEHAVLKEKYEKALAFEDALKLVSAVAGPLLGKIKMLDSAKIMGISGVDYSGKDLVSGLLAGSNYYSSRLKRELDSAAGKMNRVGGSSISNGEMAFLGNITVQSLLGGQPLVKVPGSSETSICGFTDNTDYIARVNAYPRYNEILGRFALLETPIVQGINHYRIANTPLIYSIYQFDPASLKYIFNPAAQINENGTEIWAAIEYRGTNTYSPNMYELYFTNNYETTIEIHEWNTPILPLSCLSEYLASFRRSIHSPIRLPEEAVLKLFVDFEFLNGGRAIQIYSYPMEIQHLDTEISLSLPENPTYGGGTFKYPGDLILNTTHFTQSQRIFAWSNITITGDLTADPGVTVEILAPNIEVLNESFIGSDIWLRNDFTPFGACAPLPPVSAQAVADFCSSGVYRANQASFIQEEDELIIRSDAMETQAPLPPFDVSVAPNPIRDYGMVRVLLPESGDLHARLSDLHGQAVQTLFSHRSLPAGEHLFDWSPQGLAPGMYVLTVQSAQGVQSVKVVVGQ
jgi:hypothetical protein